MRWSNILALLIPCLLPLTFLASLPSHEHAHTQLELKGRRASSTAAVAARAIRAGRLGRRRRTRPGCPWPPARARRTRQLSRTSDSSCRDEAIEDDGKLDANDEPVDDDEAVEVSWCFNFDILSRPWSRGDERRGHTLSRQRYDTRLRPRPLTCRPWPWLPRPPISPAFCSPPPWTPLPAMAGARTRRKKK